MRNETTAEEVTEQTVCDCCKLVPVAHLSLDLDPPLEGWELYLPAVGVHVQTDDCGRPAISRTLLGSLVREQAARRKYQAERGALRAAQDAQTATQVPGGRPAVQGARSGLESMMMGVDWVSPAAEFGREKPDFLGDQLAEGQRLQSEQVEKNRLRDRMRMSGKGKE